MDVALLQPLSNLRASIRSVCALVLRFRAPAATARSATYTMTPAAWHWLAAVTAGAPVIRFRRALWATGTATTARWPKPHLWAGRRQTSALALASVAVDPNSRS